MSALDSQQTPATTSSAQSRVKDKQRRKNDVAMKKAINTS